MPSVVAVAHVCPRHVAPKVGRNLLTLVGVVGPVRQSPGGGGAALGTVLPAERGVHTCVPKHRSPWGAGGGRPTPGEPGVGAAEDSAPSACSGQRSGDLGRERKSRTCRSVPEPQVSWNGEACFGQSSDERRRRYRDSSNSTNCCSASCQLLRAAEKSWSRARKLTVGSHTVFPRK